MDDLDATLWSTFRTAANISVYAFVRLFFRYPDCFIRIPNRPNKLVAKSKIAGGAGTGNGMSLTSHDALEAVCKLSNAALFITAALE